MLVKMFRAAGTRTLPAVWILGALIGFPCFASLSNYNPLSMPVGSTYTIVYATVDYVNGESSQISTFNNLVMADVDAFLPAEASTLSWCAVISTSTVNAVDNCGQNANAGGAIYNLYDGSEVADSFSDFTSQPLLNAVTQYDGGSARFIWTGSTAGGVASANPLGSPEVTIGTTMAGIPNGFDLALNNDTSYNNLYAMAEITVEAPEPASLSLIVAGAMVLVFATSARRTKRWLFRTWQGERPKRFEHDDARYKNVFRICAINLDRFTKVPEYKIGTGGGRRANFAQKVGVLNTGIQRSTPRNGFQPGVRSTHAATT